MNPVSLKFVDLSKGGVDSLAKKMFAELDPASGSAEASAAQPGFEGMLAKEIGKVMESAQSAQASIDAFTANPEGVPMERVAFLMAKAEADIRLAAQVRNKAVSAYQEIMNMQI